MAAQLELVQIPKACRCGSATSPIPPQRRSPRLPLSVQRRSFPAALRGSPFGGQSADLPSCNARRRVALAAVFGVGAPEALVVGVVALIVFGPKGLAEAAKSLGKTVRAFQPTIREIVSASTDIRSSLEESLGLDEIRQEWNNPGGSSSSQPRSLPPDLESPSRTATDYANSLTPQAARESSPEASSNGAASHSSSGNQDGNANPPAEAAWGSASALQEDPDIERKRAESAALAWGRQPAAGSQASSSPASSSQPEPQAGSREESGKKELSSLSLAELEAELARRQTSSKAS